MEQNVKSEGAYIISAQAFHPTEWATNIILYDFKFGFFKVHGSDQSNIIRTEATSNYCSVIPLLKAIQKTTLGKKQL